MRVIGPRSFAAVALMHARRECNRWVICRRWSLRTLPCCLGVVCVTLTCVGSAGAQPTGPTDQDSLKAGIEAGALAASKWSVGWYTIAGSVGGMVTGYSGYAWAFPGWQTYHRSRAFVVSASALGALLLLGHHSTDVPLPLDVRTDLAGHDAAFQRGFQEAYQRELPPRRRRILLRSGLVGAAVGVAMSVLLQGLAGT